MSHRGRITRLLGGAAAVALLVGAGTARAEDIALNIAAQPLGDALNEFAVQSKHSVVFSPGLVAKKTSQGVSTAPNAELALAQLLDGTGLSYRSNGDTFLIVSASDPQSGSAAGDGADAGTVQALIVTAQKREENIQDVPIAMSAFTQEDLTRSQVAGGPDLITQVPNMTFTKTNFSSYSIQLRGIGTQAISATVDPAVAVAFNNTPFIRNRFFEQEFYDLQRVEVLRGPQGTLYGRNATAGVVNLISAKPKFAYEAKLSADLGNYSSHRIEGMLNIPLAEDKVALRIAGAWTKRDGYAVNEVTGKSIDGRDLWSTRLSLRFTPTDRIDANLIWEHFEENDDRIRSGKQLCKTDVVTEAAGIPTPGFYDTLAAAINAPYVQSQLSQGCKPASLYSPDSYQKTNSLALPYYAPLSVVFLPVNFIGGGSIGNPQDPYASRTQSKDLRVIEAGVDPTYRAKTDIVEAQFSIDLTDSLTLNSETAWGSDFVFSTQDYNRFAGAPHAWRQPGGPSDFVNNYVARGILSTDGVFCDPQIGCSDRLVAMDLSTSSSRQFSQELRLASNFDGRFNFSLGANFLRHDAEDKYYVFINSISLLSAYLVAGLTTQPLIPYVANQTDNRFCLRYGLSQPDFYKVQPILTCTYIDPNPVGSLNDLGHNYFLSRNPYKLISYAVFGEAYYNLADNLKVTAGLRWTVDKKEAPRIPSWIFAAQTAGSSVIDVIDQEWREPTGRLAVDWKPDLAFTDETMVYASYSHGYKAGGMNPPPYGKTIYGASGNNSNTLLDSLVRTSALHPTKFDPEFVDAFELGAKNTLLDGRLTLNLASFYYDYKGYQLSQIVDRSAVTHNYDADVWGLELESDWRPVENLHLGLKLGYERTKVADGMQAIDVMDRTAGNAAWTVLRPFPSLPTNCVVPTWLLLGNVTSTPQPLDLVQLGNVGGGQPSGCEEAYLLNHDPATSAPYAPNPGRGYGFNVDYASWSIHREDYHCLPAGADPATMTAYPGVDPACLIAASNNGEGFFKQLGGKELPNAPHMTATITADYSLPLPSNWLMTLHTDLYYQSESWTRIFNTEGYDKLKAYSNINLAAIFTNEDAGWRVMAYVKNVLNRDSITGAFLNSDDSGLTTNVFLTEPRLYGLRITKDFAGGPWWTGANPDHTGPYPLTVELGGQIQRFDAPYEQFHAAWEPALSAALALGNVQNRRLDWGDGRSVKITYWPQGSLWSISASARNGETNNDTTRTNAKEDIFFSSCPFPSTYFFYNFVCVPGGPFYNPATLHFPKTQWSDAEGRDHEQYEVGELTAARHAHLGALDSTLSAALRYADLKSEQTWAANAQANWIIPVGWNCGPSAYVCSPSSYMLRHADMRAEREFEGLGPMLSWDAAAKLWGSDANGRLNLDWTVSAGALRGERKSAFTGIQESQLHSGEINITLSGYDRFLPAVGDPIIDPLPTARSKGTTIPVVDLSLGLSYEVSRVKVSTGYRWERYFDAIDSGFGEEKKTDRTIDGPYLKFAVGFGG